MLSSNDFQPNNWPVVTYQLMSDNYVRGYAHSLVIPPNDYIEWLMGSFPLHEPASIQFISDGRSAGRLIWKVIIESAREYSLPDIKIP